MLSVEQIAERLDDRFRLLTSGDRTAPPRQRTLRATIDWSHDLLAAREQVLLRRLSVFAGWSLEMAEQVCADDDLPAAAVLDLIAGLVDKSLVVVETEALGQTRYRLLDTIRDYAAQRLADAGEAAAIRAGLRDYVLRVVENSAAIGMALIPAPWSARVEIFRRYDVDADNARGVLDQCLAEADAETGLRICTAIRPCWLVRGSYAEGTERFDAFLGLDASGVPAGVRGPALVGRAQLTLASDLASAESRARDGLEVCRVAGGEVWIAIALNLLAEITLHAGRAGEAEALADQALAGAGRSVTGGPKATHSGLWRPLSGCGATCARRNGSRRPRSPSCARSTINGAPPGRCWAWATWTGSPATRAGRSGGTLKRWPFCARSTPGRRSRAAWPGSAVSRWSRRDQARPAVPDREHRAEPFHGARIGMIRGLEAFAALAAKEDRPDRAIQLIAAAAALRDAAHLPPRPAARTERILAAASQPRPRPSRGCGRKAPPWRPAPPSSWRWPGHRCRG